MSRAAALGPAGAARTRADWAVAWVGSAAVPVPLSCAHIANVRRKPELGDRAFARTSALSAIRAV
jgi:hypothetical protein